MKKRIKNWMKSRTVLGVGAVVLGLCWLWVLPAAADQLADGGGLSLEYAAATITPPATTTVHPVSCTTNSDQLNLRAGPGRNYRSLRKLARNTTVSADAMNADRRWAHIRVQPNNQVGWVDKQFLTCPAGALNGLPIGTPMPTPTPQPYSSGYTDPCIRQNCGSPGDFVGEIRIPKRVLIATDPVPVFGQHVVFELAARKKTADSSDVATVVFNIFNQRTGEEAYYHVEANAPYCVFGNSSTVCEVVWDVGASGRVWPSSDPDHPVVETIFDANPETIYQANMSVTGNLTNTDGILANGFWFFQFKIAPTGVITPPVGTPTPVPDFTGDWYTNFAEITFQQSGDRVTGSYQRYGRNEAIPLNGTVSGRTLTGNFGNNLADQVTFTLSADGNYLDGAWFYRVDGQWRQWCGTRVGLGALPDGCGFSGDWFTISDYTPDSPPTANLQQTGPRVTGTFFNGSATGTIEGVLGQAGPDPHHSLSGVYSVNGGRGAFRWDLLDFNSNQFAGCWANNEGAHEWCGWRAGGQQPAQCLANIPCP